MEVNLLVKLVIIHIEDNFPKNLNFMFMILFTIFLSFLDLLALYYVHVL